MIFIKSYADPASGDSIVVVNHKGKEFIGKAKCAVEDKFSEIEGCIYAHQRANIKAMKYDLKQKKEEYRQYRKFINGVCNYKNFDKTSPSAKAMFRHLNRKLKEIENLKAEIDARTIFLNESIKETTRIREGLKQKSLNSNNEN